MNTPFFRVIYVFVFIFLSICALEAVPAKPGATKIAQPDGYELSTVLRGDETFHFRTTTDQYVLLQDAQGYLVYAVPNAVGELTASSTRAHNIADRTAQEIAFLQTIKPNLPFGTAVRQAVKSRLLKKSSLINSNRIQKAKSISTNTSPHYLVILVEFSDNSFATADNNARFNAQLNGIDVNFNYTTDGATGSAKKYFTDNSMGSFSPTFDVYGPVKLTKPMVYYGGNDASGNDLHPDEMVSEACQLLDGSIDFSQYDANNDGSVDNIFVIYAGNGEASGGSANTIWPHASSVSANVLLDNVWLDKYGCTCELQESGIIDGIGTMCHEFTHVIGLPDFYDTDYATNGEAYGTQSWDLMGGGNYNNNSMTPPYYTAIERQMMGWGSATTPTVGNNTLNPVSTNQFFRIDTPTPNEYYLFENRQQTGWDTFIPGHGMMVYHVDKTSAYQSYWDDNKINAYSAHPCMEIVAAGETFISGFETTQPYPGTSSNNSITDFTTPNLKSWAGANLGKELFNITEASSNVSFLLLNSSDLLSVESASATSVNSTRFKANWTVTNSTSTKLNVYQKLAEVAAPTEDFATCPPASPWESSGLKSSDYTFDTRSARFYLNDAYLISGQYADAINNITFSIKTYQGKSGCTSTLELLASTDKSTWKLLKTCTSSDVVTTVSVPVDVTKNYRYFKMVFAKTYDTNNNDICVDDINVTYGGVKAYALNNQTVTGTSYNVTGLNWGEKYYYSLNGVNANESATSNETQVQLTTTPTWNGTAWIPATPASTDDATIDGNYNGVGFTCQNLIVNPGKQVTISSGTLAVGGNLTLKSDATGTATLIDNGAVTVTGTTNVEQYLSSVRNWYMSSPVTGATATNGNTYYKYVEAGNNGSTWTTVASGATFDKMTGYIVKPSVDATTFTFTGTLNTGAQSITGLTSTATAKAGYNLVGNPYPSYVNWMSATKTSLSTTIWYRTQNTTPVYVFDTYNETANTGTNNNLSGAVTGMIPPMQAFWVKVNGGTTGTLAFDNTMRAHQDGTNKFRAPAANTTQQMLRLQVSNGTNSDEAIVLFNTNATNGYDAYDSPKMTNGNTSIPEIYTFAGTEKLVINGLNSMATNKTIPIGFTTGVTNTFSIKATQVSNFDTDTRVVLKDKVLNVEQDITDGTAYTFTSAATSTNDRFVVVFKSASSTTGIDNPAENTSVVVSRNANNQIVITRNVDSQSGTVTVCNAIGQKLLTTTLTGETTVISKSFSPGVYLITVNNITKKIIIN